MSLVDGLISFANNAIYRETSVPYQCFDGHCWWYVNPVAGDLIAPLVTALAIARFKHSDPKNEPAFFGYALATLTGAAATLGTVWVLLSRVHFNDQGGGLYGLEQANCSLNIASVMAVAGLALGALCDCILKAKPPQVAIAPPAGPGH